MQPSKKVSCLIRVDFEGPEAELGPNLLVSKSNELSKSTPKGLSYKPFGADCYSVNYELVKPNDDSGMSSGGGDASYAGIGGIVIGTIVGAIAHMILF